MSTRIVGVICDVNRILQSEDAQFHAADTKPSIGVQPNYPHTRYVGLCPTNNGSTKSVWA